MIVAYSSLDLAAKLVRVVTLSLGEECKHILSKNGTERTLAFLGYLGFSFLESYVI